MKGDISTALGERGSYGFRKSCEAVKEGAPLPEVAGRYTELKQVGDKHVGLCPLHEEKTPSFYCYPDGRYHCFGCGAHGDVIDLEFFCGDFGELWEAMIALAVEHAVELPRRPQRWHEWQGEKVRRLNRLRDVLAESYRRRMFRLFRDYLAGIDDPREREDEGRAIWDDLALVARGCAELRIARRGAE